MKPAFGTSHGNNGQNRYIDWEQKENLREVKFSSIYIHSFA